MNDNTRSSLACAEDDENYVGSCVYILTNISMPGLIKIGMTTKGMTTRLNELYTTGVPTPFEVSYEHTCEEADRLETLMHELLKNWRVNRRREFFRFPVNKAVDMLKNLSSPHVDFQTSAELLMMNIFGRRITEKGEELSLL